MQHALARHNSAVYFLPMKQIFFPIFILLFPASLRAAPCHTNIGLVLPLTGNATSYGERAQRGALVAQEMLKSTCDVHLSLGDSRWESASGLAAYRSLVTKDSIDSVITASSQVSIPTRDIAAKDGVLQFAIFSASDQFSKENGSSFRICTRSEDEVKPLVEVVKAAHHKGNAPTVGALFIGNDFGEAITGDFTKLAQSEGLTVKVAERFLPTSSDFRSEIIKLKTAKVSHLLVVALPFQLLSILRTCRELQFSPTFLSPRSAEDPSVLQAPLTDGQLLYTYAFDENSADPQIRAFVARFKDQYGVKPDSYSAEAFESLRLIALATAQCGKDLVCRSNFLRSQKFPTLFGTITLNTNGDTSYPLFLKTVSHKQFAREAR